MHAQLALEPKQTEDLTIFEMLEKRFPDASEVRRGVEHFVANGQSRLMFWGGFVQFSDVAVAHAVQLAVAPVFLLTGIGAILAVMTNRLGRVIDRARVLEEKLEGASPESLATLRTDLAVLSRRAKLNGRAITLCTTTALLVCTVVAVLFLSAFLGFDASILVALLFIAAMLCFFLGLLCFLREIYLATMNLRIGAR
jgi:Protein of unknown function (DUF2721)